jgi:hypothetical protein
MQRPGPCKTDYSTKSAWLVFGAPTNCRGARQDVALLSLPAYCGSLGQGSIKEPPFINERDQSISFAILRGDPSKISVNRAVCANRALRQ